MKHWRYSGQGLGLLALVAFFVVIAFIATFARCSRAHGLAQWIERDPQTAWCCSTGRDCNPVPGRVTHDGTAWRVQGLAGALRDGERGLYWGTPDRSPWACTVPGTATLRCLFLEKADG